MDTVRDLASPRSRPHGWISASLAEAQDFGFLLVPEFSMLTFTSAVEPLRVANRLSGRNLYSG